MIFEHMTHMQREANNLLIIRDVKKKMNRAVKKMRVLGIDAIHCKRSFDSNQDMMDYADKEFGRGVIDRQNYFVCNKIREGKHTLPETLYIFWRGDVKSMCDILKGEGINCVVPRSSKDTIKININLKEVFVAS